jgi:hypothetical protein
MSFKTLFDKATKVSSLSNKSAKDIGGEVESVGYHKEDIKHEKRFIPNVDFSDPANFARYGSAEEYYIQSIDRIYDTYPYDGSLREKLQWENQSTYIDLYILNNLYPRTNGYAIFSADGWGTSSITETYGLSSDLEYVYFEGGPHANPNGMSPFSTNFTGSNYYDTSTNRESNLKYDLQNDGVTVEFWLEKDEFLTSLTEKEIIFDLWNGETYNTPTYGRLTIELTGAADGQNPFLITALSGTTGITRQTLTNDSTFTTASVADGNWHHYAVSLISASAGIETKFYVDGSLKSTITQGSSGINEVTGALRANLAAAITSPAGTSAPAYSGKLSGSLDEFRYWKTQRSSKDVGRYFISQVGGGTNTDPEPFTDTQEDVNTKLGVYYKFNEGITGVSSTDSVVLDYAGRVTNGAWTGYGTNSRNTGSAIVLSNAATKEFLDPIIRSNHPDVITLRANLANSGSAYDVGNNASIYNSIPAWITEQDSEGQKQTKYLTQIISSYFDTLHIQASDLNNLKNIEYVSGSDKPFPFSYKKLNSHGFVAPEIFLDADILEKLADRSEDRIYDKSLNDIKNIIYQNIYNNLTYIYKTKGTEKSFRNLIRSFGIDDELIKLNMYAQNTEYEFRENRRTILVNDKLINFNNNINKSAVVYSFSSSVNPDSTGVIAAATELTGGYAITLEADVTFPTKPLESQDGGYFFTNAISSSIFGVHSALADQTDTTWDAQDAVNFQVLSIRDELNSDNARFMLTGTAGGYVPELTSSLYEDLYTDSTWNLSVRIKPEKYPLSYFADGADSGNYTVVFSGVEVRSGEIVNTFSVSETINSPPDSFISGSRRVFLGAHRTNVTGTVLQTSDVKINSCRFWLDYVEDKALQEHALDTENHGALRPSLYAFPWEANALYGEVSKLDTLAFNWEFSQNTGSNASGEFTVEDESSGSATLASTRFGWIGDIVNKQVTAKGYGFEASSTSPIKKDFIVAARLNELETIAPSETVQVLSAQDQKEFKIDSRPINYFFAFEKSMSKVISEEMINTFGSLKDFNNLIGDGVNRYRDEYKTLKFVRQKFFEKVGNDEIDFDRFYEFYKWFDSSLSFMLGQLVPASAEFADNVRTVVESHALERSKYRNVFPFIDSEKSVFEATASSNVDYGDAISSPDDDLQGTGFYPAHAPRRRTVGLSARELVKKWKYDHAPEDADQKKNYLWWKNKAERDNPTISENSDVNNSRGAILSVIDQISVREAFRPYRFSIGGNKILGGVGQHQNKDVNFVFQATQPYGPVSESSNIPINIMLSFDADVERLLDTDDEFFPTYKQRLGFGLNPDINRNNDNKLKMNGNKLAPFSLYETTEQSTFNAIISSSYKPGVTITNLHHDLVIDTDIAAQSPFTEKFVGGRYYRHSELNAGSDSRDTRAEGFRLALGLNTGSSNIPVGASGALGIIPPNYPFLDSPAGSAPHGWLPELPTAQRFRDETAKRPVNIKNILMTTASVGTRLSGTIVHNQIGNYQKNYQVVQTSGRSINDPFFQDQSFSFAPNPETLATRGRFPLTTDTTENTGGDLDYALPDRIGANSNKTVFVNLFSSPGSYEVLSRGYRDPAHEELSVYNALPYRNLGIINRGLSGSNTDNSLTGSIRVNDHINKPRGLNQLATLHAGAFGHDPVFGSVPELTYVTTPSWHKTNRNSLRRIESSSAGYFTASVYDNLFVQHAIPRSTQQYSWVTASLKSGEAIFGLQPPTYYSASVLNKLIVSGAYEDTTFADLNTAVLDALTASTHTEGFPLSSDAIASYINADYWASPALDNDEDYFNVLTSMRNGPWGYPTWKQIRTGETKVARKLRETNQIGLITPPPQVPVTLTDGTTYQYVRGLKSNDFVDYTEQPISSRYAPTSVLLEDNTENSDTLNNVSLKVTFGNELDFFSNEPLNNRLNIPAPNLANTSLNKVFEYVTSSQLSTIIDYKERVYPAEINAYKNIVRRRTDFTITNIWDDNRADRSIKYGGLRNSQGYVFDSTTNSTPTSIWPLDPHINFATTQSIGPFVTSSLASAEGEGELLNSRSRFYRQPDGFKGVAGMPTYAARVPAGSSSAGGDLVFAGDALWEAGSQSGKVPHQSYTSYSERIALAGKDHSIVPEFRISELIETYTQDKANDFLADVDNIFNLTGATIYDSSEANFFKTYTNSDFIKYFSVIDEGLNDKRSGDLKIKRDKISLRCNALLKFLPYKGFYPVERTLELATLLSKSYGDYIEINATGSDITFTGQGAAYRAFMEPLMAPGILYNTIKSGLAVSNMILTNQGTDAETVRVTEGIPTASCAPTDLPEGTVQYKKMINLVDGPNQNGYILKKLPFEALQRPLSYLDTNLLTGSGAFYDTGVSEYDELVSRAGPPAVTGSDYVKINAGKKLYELAIDNFLCETTNFFMDGLAYLKSKREDQFQSVRSGSSYSMTLEVFRTLDSNLEVDRAAFDLYARESAFGYPLGQGLDPSTNPEQSASFGHVVPPYYHGNTTSKITFTAPRSGLPTIEEIAGNITVEDTTTYPHTMREDYLMKLSDSVITTDFLTEVPEGTNEQFRTWFFQTKFETPILNFADASYTQTATSSVEAGLTNAQDIKINGMWHQYGSQITSSNEGVFLRIRQDESAGSNQLAEVLGFDAGIPIRIGKPKEANILEEAVVAIPYKTNKNRREFFGISERSSNYDVIKQHMEKYVFPPKFDFVTNKTVEPILMYVFEFFKSVTQQDITDMWQNLPPEAGEKFEQKEVLIEERELVDYIFDQSDEIQWMVFKVKKKAVKNYDKYRRSLISEDTSAFPETIGNYSYNWPYDYFSLVELVKIDETVRYISGDIEE